MMPVVIWSPTNFSNSLHRWNWNGRPAVGNCWNIIARLLAYPVSCPDHIGDDADSASRWGYWFSSDDTIGKTLSRWLIPT